MQAYSNSLFAPHMIAEFGWSRALFALQGSLSVAMFLIVPLIGRLTDVLGARRIALFGVIAMPLAHIAFSLQTGNIALFFALSIAKMVIAATTASLVYCRFVALSFTAARGLALAICASAPALLMTVGAPLLGGLIEVRGWRAGYQALAALSLTIGLLAVLILPRDRTANGGRQSEDAGNPADRDAKKDYRTIFAIRAFWIIFIGMFLCNMPTIIVASQFGLMLSEQGVPLSTVPQLVSLYAASVIVGRFACGLALDRLAPHMVAAVSLAMPAVGLLMLGSGVGIMAFISAGVIFIGLAQGAEGDLVAYMVAHYFPKELYGTVAGMIAAGMALSAAVGAITLSVVLNTAGTFYPFLQFMGLLTLIGALQFGMLRGDGKNRGQVPAVQ